MRLIIYSVLSLLICLMICIIASLSQTGFAGAIELAIFAIAIATVLVASVEQLR